MVERKNVHGIFVEKPLGKRSLGKA